MAKKLKDDFIDDGDMVDDLEEADYKLEASTNHTDARRKLELLMEERALEHLISGW